MQDATQKQTVSPDREEKKEYAAPRPVAANSPQGNYAAGCPGKDSYQCKSCFRQ
jgi:hypothetical protein